MGTERADAFQKAIEDELTRRGYTSEPDSVMAEYITIMVINNKTPEQITSELEDYSSFISWLFEEAAKGASGTDAPPPTSPAPVAQSQRQPGPSKEAPTNSNDSTSRRPPGAGRNGVYQQAISQVTPGSAQKRSASARSPSPSHPNKSRKTDLPTGPRAMQKESSSSNSRSLLDRMGPGRANGHSRDEIQRRIEAVTANAPDASMMMNPAFAGMPPQGMDMNMNMMNPAMMQDMVMNQMALMAHMATSMGLLNPATGQFNNPGFVMPNGMGGDMAMMQNGFPGHGPHGGPQRGRGSGRARGTGRRGNAPAPGSTHASQSQETTAEAAPIAAPVPVTPSPITPTVSASGAAAETKPVGTYAIPERPQSPTLCKFGTKCTNVHCRYSHPSPVATAESGIVLSNEPCEQGKECKDKDCTKAHVSPAVLNPKAEAAVPNATAPPPRHSQQSGIPCRFGLACTRPGCSYSHPPRQPCRFGAACTRANCTFQHPPGRVLPSTFHRGLSTSGGMVNVTTPETGSMGGASHNKSMTFNVSATSKKEDLEKKVKELEEQKQQMEKAMKEAASKKADNKPVALAA
ncbi:polyadenylated RNA binding protein [Coprinopsis cinerea okayama7|uniref:Polyadenylated RNA binding protein n=1 Tax=Coprinopsis cinerea (strain Okayama-7 / 130 / ATCC MYA-4618 / FGSC 9003) TaxID=240176 RepID=A8N5R6_COPC7|nr:polyadenylated RNA binding protein [Coprinopsis cinerea okayama7\|eukprot:XP_001830211.2 polyadenylated RNA binding protein [Coprinopsis cinerea okayama7\